MKAQPKTIWITGASSGIGEALTYYYAKQGHYVIISARREDALKKVKEQCENSGQVGVLPLDLADTESMHNKVKQALEIFGPIDILVNNAGISQRSKIMETELSVYKTLVDINYIGTLALTKALLPYFIEQGHGHFAVVTSVMGRFGSMYRSGYCGSKHALHGFFDVLRMEHEKDGVSVTMICPGFVNTNVALNALTGTGAAQGYNDETIEQGMDPKVLAQKMAKAIAKKKFEVYIGGFETMGVYVKRFFPKLLHKMVLRSKVT
ncbi:SDR family oxidoreductase [Sediminicola luteus]|uniref:Short chain dehydrogenase n=1 Tax=Sediminicola luteus TaxID=319238 RepID=A0A2A4G626_9FLAO|nr:SDR family oxidoreductase [Sediminicola luteus]PCE63881.1 short chain dehydrogenase [Sediminicola luteus]